MGEHVTGSPTDAATVTRMRWVSAMGVTLLVSLTLVACGGTSDEAASPQQPPTVETTPAEGRELAPAVAGESLEGEAIALGDFRGRPVLVNVWSSW